MNSNNHQLNNGTGNASHMNISTQQSANQPQQALLNHAAELTFTDQIAQQQLQTQINPWLVEGNNNNQIPPQITQNNFIVTDNPAAVSAALLQRVGKFWSHTQKMWAIDSHFNNALYKTNNSFKYRSLKMVSPSNWTQVSTDLRRGFRMVRVRARHRRRQTSVKIKVHPVNSKRRM